MSRKKRLEQLAVYKIVKIKGLKPRFDTYKKRYSGEVVCVCDKTGKKLKMIWDGSGYDKNDKLVLIEAELINDLNIPHIHTHLSRIACMQGANMEISCLIWIVFPSQINNIREIVDNYLHFFSVVCSVKFPTIEYWDDTGKQYPSH